jgi:integrase
MGRRAKSGGIPELKPDGDGIFYRELGWKQGKEPGKFRQHKFYLGGDLTEAQVRYLRLSQVWEATEKRWVREGESGRPLWDETTLAIAQAVSRGESECRLELPRWAIVDESDAATMVCWLQDLQKDFYMIRLSLTDEEMQSSGEREWHDHGARLIAHGQKLMQKNVRQTLHEALDAFGEYLRQRYSDNAGLLSLTGQVAAKEIPLLKSHIKDMPLGDFDLEAIDAWVDYWSKRPITKRNKPAAPKTCTNAIKRIRMFIRWLHRAKEWDWRKPEDYEVMPVKVKVSAVELARRASGDQVETYTEAELATLWKHAKPKERLYMLLALNTGAGIAEIASLQTNEIHLDKSHRKYGTPGNWIMRIRLKTGVYGEWRLWDQTVEAIRWYLGVRPKNGQTALVLTEDGDPVLDQTAGGNRAQTIPNTWGRVVARVRKLEDKEFRKLSFNKLRKTAINAIRDIAGGEVAGVFACHGKPVPTDGLLDLYSNRDFRRVHDACVKWGERLAPMFAQVPEPFVPAKRKHRKPDAIVEKRRRVVELRDQGKTLAQIGEEMGLSIGAVRNHLAKAAAEAPVTATPAAG